MVPIDDRPIAEPDLLAMLQTVFGVSQTGLDVCVHVTKAGPVTTSDVASALDVNRSTVSRQLNRLAEIGVVERREESLDGGGRVHRYRSVPPTEASQRLREGLLRWVVDASELLEEVNERKLAAASDRVHGDGTSVSVPGDE